MYSSDAIAARPLGYMRYGVPVFRGIDTSYSAQPAYLYTAADYMAAFQSLLPRGRVWSRDPDTTLAATVAGLTEIYERTNARANDLIAEAFPATTFELLPEWEATLGLPDPCAGISPTIQQRRGQVLARFCGTGGQSAGYMINYAHSLGYIVTITQFTASRAGQSRVGQPMCSEAWTSVWMVNAPNNTVTRSRVGLSAAGEPLASWGNQVLRCELQAIAPAHTTLLFNFT